MKTFRSSFLREKRYAPVFLRTSALKKMFLVCALLGLLIGLGLFFFLNKFFLGIMTGLFIGGVSGFSLCFFLLSKNPPSKK